MSVPIGEYPRIYSCPFASAFIYPQLQCALASAHLPWPAPLPWPTPVPWPFAASHLVFGLLHGQVGDGKMVWHVGMGKWAGQVGMRTQNQAHGAAPAPRTDNCALGQDVSSPPARPQSITSLFGSGACRCNLCGYIVRRAIFAGSHFTLGAFAHWPMRTCAIA